ncbi:MAG: tetratricopeptide repeat protein [Fimbriimonas sp.]
MMQTRAALQVTPTNPKLHAYLGLCYFRQNDFNNAEVCFRRAGTLDEKFWEAGAKQAQCLDRLHRYEEAYRVAKHWLKVNPRDRTLQGIAMALEHQVKGDHQEGWERTRGIGYQVQLSSES